MSLTLVVFLSLQVGKLPVTSATVSSPSSLGKPQPSPTSATSPTASRPVLSSTSPQQPYEAPASGKTSGDTYKYIFAALLGAFLTHNLTDQRDRRKFLREDLNGLSVAVGRLVFTHRKISRTFVPLTGPDLKEEAAARRELRDELESDAADAEAAIWFHALAIPNEPHLSASVGMLISALSKCGSSPDLTSKALLPAQFAVQVAIASVLRRSLPGRIWHGLVTPFRSETDPKKIYQALGIKDPADAS
jgi:hypothetical protein